jgi:hypothetical protein
MTGAPNMPPGTGDTPSGVSGVVNYGTMTGPVAAGAQARATQTNIGSSAEDIRAQLELALRQLASVAASELDSAGAAQVSDDATRLTEEIHHHRLDRERITGLLRRLTAAAASAAPLLEVIDRVRVLIEALLH